MEKIIELLTQSQAMLEGHFLLSSGRHSDRYFQCAKLFQYPDKARKALETVAEIIKKEVSSGNLKIDMTAGPAIGGIIPAWELARQLSIPAIFTERDESGKMVLRRGFEITSGQNILIVEDVVTTGKSSLECAAALESQGAVIAGLACIVDRRSSSSSSSSIDMKVFPWPFFSCVKLDAGNWDASECDLCKQNIPAIKPGSRKI